MKKENEKQKKSTTKSGQEVEEAARAQHLEEMDEDETDNATGEKLLDEEDNTSDAAEVEVAEGDPAVVGKSENNTTTSGSSSSCSSSSSQYTSTAASCVYSEDYNRTNIQINHEPNNNNQPALVVSSPAPSPSTSSSESKIVKGRTRSRILGNTSLPFGDSGETTPSSNIVRPSRESPLKKEQEMKVEERHANYKDQNRDTTTRVETKASRDVDKEDRGGEAGFNVQADSKRVEPQDDGSKAGLVGRNGQEKTQMKETVAGEQPESSSSSSGPVRRQGRSTLVSSSTSSRTIIDAASLTTTRKTSITAVTRKQSSSILPPGAAGVPPSSRPKSKGEDQPASSSSASGSTSSGLLVGGSSSTSMSAQVAGTKPKVQESSGGSSSSSSSGTVAGNRQGGTAGTMGATAAQPDGDGPTSATNKNDLSKRPAWGVGRPKPKVVVEPGQKKARTRKTAAEIRRAAMAAAGVPSSPNGSEGSRGSKKNAKKTVYQRYLIISETVSQLYRQQFQRLYERKSSTTTASSSTAAATVAGVGGSKKDKDISSGGSGDNGTAVSAQHDAATVPPETTSGGDPAQQRRKKGGEQNSAGDAELHGRSKSGSSGPANIAGDHAGSGKIPAADDSDTVMGDAGGGASDTSGTAAGSKSAPAVPGNAARRAVTRIKELRAMRDMRAGALLREPVWPAVDMSSGDHYAQQSGRNDAFASKMDGEEQFQQMQVKGDQHHLQQILWEQEQQQQNYQLYRTAEAGYHHMSAGTAEQMMSAAYYVVPSNPSGAPVLGGAGAAGGIRGTSETEARAALISISSISGSSPAAGGPGPGSHTTRTTGEGARPRSGRGVETTFRSVSAFADSMFTAGLVRRMQEDPSQHQDSTSTSVTVDEYSTNTGLPNGGEVGDINIAQATSSYAVPAMASCSSDEEVLKAQAGGRRDRIDSTTTSSALDHTTKSPCNILEVVAEGLRVGGKRPSEQSINNSTTATVVARSNTTEDRARSRTNSGTRRTTSAGGGEVVKHQYPPAPALAPVEDSGIASMIIGNKPALANKVARDGTSMPGNNFYSPQKHIGQPQPEHVMSRGGREEQLFRVQEEMRTISSTPPARKNYTSTTSSTFAANSSSSSSSTTGGTSATGRGPPGPSSSSASNSNSVQEQEQASRTPRVRAGSLPYTSAQLQASRNVDQNTGPPKKDSVNVRHLPQSLRTLHARGQKRHTRQHSAGNVLADQVVTGVQQRLEGYAVAGDTENSNSVGEQGLSSAPLSVPCLQPDNMGFPVFLRAGPSTTNGLCWGGESSSGRATMRSNDVVVDGLTVHEWNPESSNSYPVNATKRKPIPVSLQVRGAQFGSHLLGKK
ncbi:unnamed protein product [Amoebophrya sp. A25]|nr:unnamed protein product [Amoebophrya sp. A25]|eukprot:GSA25T00016044001.1